MSPLEDPRVRRVDDAHYTVDNGVWTVWYIDDVREWFVRSLLVGGKGKWFDTPEEAVAWALTQPTPDVRKVA